MQNEFIRSTLCTFQTFTLHITILTVNEFERDFKQKLISIALLAKKYNYFYMDDTILRDVASKTNKLHFHKLLRFSY